MSRLDIRKTYKLFIGGKYARSEGGHVIAALDDRGQPLDNIPRATRKDLRDAVTAARAAADGWAKVTAYNRGQILYRAAEMLENRGAELITEIARSTGVDVEEANQELGDCVDRLVYYAGWTDKVTQVFGGVNPVASSHFNFTVPDPTGVVAVFAPETPSLLGLISVLAPVLVGGNTAVVFASERYPLPALTFAEIIGTSDVPGGVVNLLAGKRADVAAHAASHLDINAIVDATGDTTLRNTFRGGVAVNMKRYSEHIPAKNDWSTAENPRWILDTLEWKTAWHPIGV
jgi:acyl-CoA reductase-like NAD-dependent aldehyde dehydrogenase